MPIFSEYSGPVGEKGYYSAADWEKLNNPDWAKDQATYDAFAAQAAARAANRAEAMARAREAIPYSYTQFGRGGTEPVFSLAGFAGQSAGGTSGLAGFSGTGSPTGTTTTTDTSSYDNVTPVEPIDPRPDPNNPEVYFEERAEGGVILPVQYMQEGGMIASPYAKPMGSLQPVGAPPPEMSEPMPMMTSTIMETPNPQTQMPQPAIGGLFQQLHKQFGNQMGQMQAQPLRVYQNYLMQTYAQPEMQAQQQKVDHFLDLVDQAERAHFGAEESYGFGGGPMMQQYMPQPQVQMDRGPMPGSGIMGGGIASLAPAVY